MESYKVENLTFTYPNTQTPALSNITFNVMQGEFITVCGKSGCGKSTLLRHLKPLLSPHGDRRGTILFENNDISELGTKEQSQKIGFVMQSPDNQIVTDKVWHELAFGLESLSYSTKEIRTRVAEMASFFGIQTWFHKRVTELSGGQKQLLNLASIMVMQPSVLLLDEPTSQLDPIAAHEFLGAVSKINRELGTTIVLTEHRLEEAFPLSDRVLVMENGNIITYDTTDAVGEKLKIIKNDMFVALPTAMRVHAAIPNELPCPVTVREGRKWISEISEVFKPCENNFLKSDTAVYNDATVIELSEVWFRYEKNLPDVVKGLSLKVREGELLAIVGGNGTGKTTALSIISGLQKPYRGNVRVGENKKIVMLPQNPQAVFVKKTVALDLYEAVSDTKLSKAEKDERVQNVIELCELSELIDRHPYDLSGGEQQRAALAKILLLNPDVLLLDEPTKGIDAHFKQKLADILNSLKQTGITIIMVSHDVEFCAEYADKCAMFFDGSIVSEDKPREFFSGKSFYTTAANRMARAVIPKAVLADDIILALGGKVLKKEHNSEHLKPKKLIKPKEHDGTIKSEKKITYKNIIFGSISAVLFIAVQFLLINDYIKRALSVLFFGLSLANFIPQKSLDSTNYCVQAPKERRKLSKRTVIAAIMILIAIPLTIYIGVFYLGDKKYYFISLLIILETMLPFGMIFESRKPQARELVIVSVLCAIAVAGRAAFFMLPQFKPVVALVIIAGVCFGGETGFLVGSITGFVSNFFFGQGPWTPWQMFAFGIIGFLAGILFRKGLLRKTKASLCIFGGLSTLIIYGGIMNPASVIMWQAKPNINMFLSAYAMGLPFDLIHAFATVFFLWFISAPMIEKLDRIKIKYGLVE